MLNYGTNLQTIIISDEIVPIVQFQRRILQSLTGKCVNSITAIGAERRISKLNLDSPILSVALAFTLTSIGKSIFFYPFYGLNRNVVWEVFLTLGGNQSGRWKTVSEFAQYVCHHITFLDLFRHNADAQEKLLQCEFSRKHNVLLVVTLSNIPAFWQMPGVGVGSFPQSILVFSQVFKILVEIHWTICMKFEFICMNLSKIAKRSI